MEFTLDPLPPVELQELRELLVSASYSTTKIRNLLGLSDTAEAILSNIGRYSIFYLDELAQLETPASVLARLFLLSGRVSIKTLRCLDSRLTEILWRRALIQRIPGNQQMIRASVSITEISGQFFLSDRLFENTGSEFILEDFDTQCMPPHASSLQLQRGLRASRATGSFLDVGCGTGCQSILLASGYKRIVGIDTNANAVRFARMNAILNAVACSYEVAGWESFADDDGFDHIAFNPDGLDEAFSFIDSALPRVLAADGHAQILTRCELTSATPTVLEALKARIRTWDELDVEIEVHSDSLFAVTPEEIGTRRLAPTSLAFPDPSGADRYLRDLESRDVMAIACLTLTVQRRPRDGGVGTRTGVGAPPE